MPPVKNIHDQCPSTSLCLQVDLVSGDGYQCMKTQIRSTFDEGIFGDTHAETTIINIRLSKDECKAMVQRKVYGNAAQMECAGSTCWYTPKIAAKYQCFQKITMIDYSCHFTTRTIVAPTESRLLFGTKCKAIDLYCILHDSTVIWNDKIINMCPFNHIRY